MLKLDALAFLRTSFDSHPSSGALIKSDLQLVSLVASIVKEEWYKVIAEALRMLSSIVAAVRGGQTQTLFQEASSQQSQTLVNIIYSAIYSRLEALDIDQEIKDCAINAIGKVSESLINLILTSSHSFH